MGTSLKNPFAQIETMNTVAIVIAAIIQFVQSAIPSSSPEPVMLLIAVGASISPIIITTGPVTIGGKSERITSLPTNLTTTAMITYITPATIIPPQA